MLLRLIGSRGRTLAGAGACTLGASMAAFNRGVCGTASVSCGGDASTDKFPDNSIFKYKLMTIDGQEVTRDPGKAAILIVNVASQ
jgi:hypothetical protein